MWYGKKIKYDIGLYWNGKPYYFNRGIYIIDGFDFSYTTSQREVTYQLKDKFCIYAGTTGTLDVGYEIPVDTPIEEVISSIQNFSNIDGTVNDLKSCIIDTKYTGFKTQATIRVEAGGKDAEREKGAATPGACLFQDPPCPGRAETAEKRQSKSSLPTEARKRLYHSRRSRPLFQGERHFQTAEL